MFISYLVYDFIEVITIHEQPNILFNLSDLRKGDTCPLVFQNMLLELFCRFPGHRKVFRFPDSAVWKKQKCFFPIHVWKSVLRGASVSER